jgi:hypothetical protein
VKLAEPACGTESSPVANAEAANFAKDGAKISDFRGISINDPQMPRGEAANFQPVFSRFSKISVSSLVGYEKRIFTLATAVYRGICCRNGLNPAQSFVG